MCVLLHLLICTALRAHIIVVEALYKINYYYYYLTDWTLSVTVKKKKKKKKNFVGFPCVVPT